MIKLLPNIQTSPLPASGRIAREVCEAAAPCLGGLGADVLQASGVAPESARKILAAFDEWRLERPGAAELVAGRLECMTFGEHVSEAAVARAAALGEFRMFYRERLGAHLQSGLDEASWAALRDGGVIDNSWHKDVFLICSQSWAAEDAALVSGAVAARDLAALSRHYFEQYAQPGEVYHDWVVARALEFLGEDRQADVWPQAVERAVVGTILDGRSKFEVSRGYAGLQDCEKEAVDAAQVVLDRFFRDKFGEDFPFKLRENTFFGPVLSRADMISGRAYIEEDLDFRRRFAVTVHENVHLGGRSDCVLFLNGVTALREGMIEYLTFKSIEGCPDVGEKQLVEFNEQYLDWARGWKVMIIDHLFEGDDALLLDFYRDGDVGRLGQRLKEAVECKGELAYDYAEAAPLPYCAQMVYDEMQVIIGLARGE